MGSPAKTIALIPKRSKPEAIELAERAAVWLIEKGRAVISESGALIRGTVEVSSAELAARADLIVVLGGDGTLLHAARLCRGYEVPILGVNLGTLGFMTEMPKERLFPVLETVLAGESRIERRSKIEVQIIRDGWTLLEAEVLNDVVVSKNALARIADIEAIVGGAHLTMFRADGVIVSTPTGSSAYSLAAGGPLVHPSVHAFIIAPICPHTLAHRPLVMADDTEIELVLRSESEMFATLDGQYGREMECGDRVRIRRAKTAVALIREDGMSYYDVLRDKLKWGNR